MSARLKVSKNVTCKKSRKLFWNPRPDPIPKQKSAKVAIGDLYFFFEVASGVIFFFRSKLNSIVFDCSSPSSSPSPSSKENSVSVFFLCDTDYLGVSRLILVHEHRVVVLDRLLLFQSLTIWVSFAEKPSKTIKLSFERKKKITPRETSKKKNKSPMATFADFCFRIGQEGF